MMGWDWLGGLASGIVSGLADTGTALINRQSVLDTNAQNERLQREEWGREDTSVQRRMKDLVAAGLNPVLAAGGQGAPTSLTARMEAPEIPMGIGSRAIAAALTAQQIGRTKADQKISEAQGIFATYRAQSEAFKAHEESLKEAGLREVAANDALISAERLKQAQIETEVKNHDWEILKKTKFLSNISGMPAAGLGSFMTGIDSIERTWKHLGGLYGGIQSMLKGKFGSKGSRRYLD